MEFEEAKEKFLNTWGVLGSKWGINRTMSQIHALLMITPEPLSAEDIMSQLKVSRGNVNMNVRELIDWGLIEKVIIPGERKEFFEADNDPWTVFKQVAKERRRRELEPVFKVLADVKNVKKDKKREKEIDQFVETVKGIESLSLQVNKVIEKTVKADKSWFLGPIMKLMR